MSPSHTAAPHSTEIDIEVGPGDWPAQELYYLMTGLVIPRPIGWV